MNKCCSYDFKTSTPKGMHNKTYITFFANTLLDIGLSYADRAKNDPMFALGARVCLNIAKDLKKCNIDRRKK